MRDEIALGGEQLVQPTAHRIPAPDGAQVPCFAYTPPEPDGSAVVIIHGGPEGQSVRTFNPIVQALAARGHTVLVPNVRGSTGYGKSWYSADDGRDRLRSVDDLAALHDRMRSAARGASAEVGPLVRRFHDIVGELARSRKLLWFLGIALRYTPGRVTASLPGWPEMAVTDHHRILQAMSDGVPAAARAATQRHVVHSGRLLIHHLERRGMWTGESENRPPGEEFRIT